MKKSGNKRSTGETVKKILQLILGLVLVALGILSFVQPDLLTTLICLSVLIYGAGTLITWLSRRKTGTRSGWSLAIAIFSIGAGIGLVVASFSSDALKNAGRGFRRKLKDLKKNRESKYMTVLLLYIAANTDINKDKLAAVATTLYREQLAGLFLSGKYSNVNYLGMSMDEENINDSRITPHIYEVRNT